MMKHLNEGTMTRASAAAVLAWTHLLRTTFLEQKAEQIIVPMVTYNAEEVGYGGSKRRFSSPLVVELGCVEEDLILEHIESEAMHEDEDRALSSNILILDHEDGLRMRKLDLVDVDPSHVFHPADTLPERYNILRTANSYHLYPKKHTCADSGGREIVDEKWTRGFLRVTESAVKGRIHQWRP